MSAALSGTRIERNTIISSKNDTATTAAMNKRQPVRDPFGQVGDHGLTRQQRLGVRALDSCGEHVGTEGDVRARRSSRPAARSSG